MTKKTVNQPVRGSTTGRPIMVLLDILGQRWTLRILWELRDSPLSFRALRQRCDQVSPTVLNDRLKILRESGLVQREDGTGYRLSQAGEELGTTLLALNRWAETHWAGR
ncbi:helix-turn-helix domain-containing protein [Alcanivorax sp. 24]|uniref:winged helix-turn-helix transcriptional regulator n=1 Tax=Alcanivorax sp. 24 TaxID=2545266 RepID=UPI00105BEBB5|nr:helix-turn-helix domain-containing protein [Alcanivorax sp. 24]